jgi:hypothetical protein
MIRGQSAADLEYFFSAQPSTMTLTGRRIARPEYRADFNTVDFCMLQIKSKLDWISDLYENQ